MKKIILAIFGLILFTSRCTSQTYMESGVLTSVMAQEEFTFRANKVNVNNQDVINSMNALPGGSVGRMQSLTPGYDIVFKNKEMQVYLPYFGRTYSTSTNNGNLTFDFTSKDFSIDKKEDKNGKKTWTIKPNDINYISAMYLEIYSNGKAYLSINANDRQPASYNGFIMKNEVKKEK